MDVRLALLEVTHLQSHNLDRHKLWLVKVRVPRYMCVWRRWVKGDTETDMNR